jgi:hypothetical protein
MTSNGNTIQVRHPTALNGASGSGRPSDRFFPTKNSGALPRANSRRDITFVDDTRSECSQILTTRHPSLRSCELTSLSLVRLAVIFFLQNALLFFGWRKHFGHPCQKQPSTKTANLFFRKTKSGLPGSLACRLQPMIPLARNNRTSASSVRSLPRPRIRDMTSERFSLVKTSATAEQP